MDNAISSTEPTGPTPSHHVGTTPSWYISPTPCPCKDTECKVPCPSQGKRSLTLILGSSVPLALLVIVGSAIFTISVCKYQSKCTVTKDRAQSINEEEGILGEEERVEERRVLEREDLNHIYEEVSPPPPKRRLNMCHPLSSSTFISLFFLF